MGGIWPLSDSIKLKLSRRKFTSARADSDCLILSARRVKAYAARELNLNSPSELLMCCNQSKPLYCNKEILLFFNLRSEVANETTTFEVL